MILIMGGHINRVIARQASTVFIYLFFTYFALIFINCIPAPMERQCCHLSQIIRESPDFGPYFPVSRLESEISWKISEVCHFL